ncbi:aminotransferase class V-fold PLP-dependent enzyme [Halocatena halophila]|uniref:aminotransferase class V-fold PLP-dependent enzyme n=1 Tax=Halocatena halophila TaxID=2814576 RepID=UPI002ECFF42E
MNSQDSIYRTYNVSPVINAAGTKTRIGGSRIRPEAIDAMERAAESFVVLSELQSAASERISELTGAQAGYVTAGASAGLLLSAAAAIAGDDFEVMAELPATKGVADEIIMPRTHRTAYDHAFTAAGATIVDVGTNDVELGTGAATVEPWELRGAITEQTAAIGYVEKSYTQPPLAVVTEIAHEHDIPVIVDAAAEIPPVENFERFIDAGADLVVFSGGKAIRGPQTTGIVAGRSDLIESIALQNLDMHIAREIWDAPAIIDSVALEDGVPRHGIGRSAKVGKEELAGLLAALESFVTEDQDAVYETWMARSTYFDQQLGGLEGIETAIDTSGESRAPVVEMSLDPAVIGQNATEIAADLRSQDPRLFVGSDRLTEDMIVLNPMCLTDEEVEYVLERLLEAITPQSTSSFEPFTE